MLSECAQHQFQHFFFARRLRVPFLVAISSTNLLFYKLNYFFLLAIATALPLRVRALFLVC